MLTRLHMNGSIWLMFDLQRVKWLMENIIAQDEMGSMD